MKYAIVGFGKIGHALAHAFARKNIDVTVASRRPPEALRDDRSLVPGVERRLKCAEVVEVARVHQRWDSGPLGIGSR